MTNVAVQFLPNWVNGSWLRVFTVPFLQVDGREYQCSWKQPLRLETDPGVHTFRCFVRYKKLIPGEGGSSERQIAVPDAVTLFVDVRNSFTNGSPFVPKVRTP